MSEMYSVRHNISAMFAHRQSMVNNGTLDKSLERLSSGYRINTSADDVAGLAVSEKLRTQVRGFHQAANNIQDGMSFLQVGDAALQDVHDILQRMRELLIQSANGVYADTDRAHIQLEIDQLIDEIDRINTATEFATKSLFQVKLDIVWVIDNSISMLPEQTALATSAPTFVDSLNQSGIDFRLGVVGFSNTPQTSVVGNFTTSATQFATDVLAVGTAGSGTENGMFGLNFALNNFSYRSDARKVFVLLTDEDADDAGAFFTSSDQLQATADIMNANDVIVHYVGNNNAPPDAEYTAGTGIFALTGGTASALPAAGDFGTALGNIIRNSPGLPTKFHVGANEGQLVESILPSSVSAFHLGVNTVSAATQDLANSSLSMIDSAINLLTRKRSSIGSEVNRLEFTLDYARVVEEALQSAESRIRDADMAAEIIDFTKSQVIVQSANAMLAQANLLPQNVLSLLG